MTVLTIILFAPLLTFVFVKTLGVFSIILQDQTKSFSPEEMAQAIEVMDYQCF